ncbi:MAG TPA: exopolysaccharide biosynthesis polyprenyl glycosylphosphotransferase [Anaerolineaceae bacterium]
MGSLSTTQKAFQIRLHSGERKLILLAGDALMAGLSLIVALYFWGQRDFLDFPQFVTERIPPWFFLLPIFWLILNVEMYDVRRAGRRGETIKGIAIAAGVSLVLYLLLFFLADKTSPLPRRGVLVYIFAAPLLMIAWRFTYIKVFTTPEFLRRVLVVGAGRSGATLVQVIKEMWPPPFYLVGLIDDDPQKCDDCLEGYPVLGTSRNLLDIIEHSHVTDLIFAITGEMQDDMFQALLQAEEGGIEVTTMPQVYEDLLGRVPISLLRSDWILRSFVDEARANGLYELGKRIIDILGGWLGVCALVAVTPFIGVLILLESGWPIFYTQSRLGKNGREYRIIKFRSMRESCDLDGNLLPDKERITRVGWFLRKTHIDEMPQFINVLRGEMSLVGPRAEISQLVTDLQSKVPFYRARLLVKPGITGWAQVNFSYAATVEETAVKLEYDLYYIKHRNLALDFVILLRTVGTVVGFRGQ